MCRVVLFFLQIACLSLGCHAGNEVEAEPANTMPSILWVTIDTIRADHLGAYGYFRNTSPRFDALAERSLLFERCLAPIATTLPSHLSALTGLYPTEHGVLALFSAIGWQVRILPDDMHERLAAVAKNLSTSRRPKVARRARGFANLLASQR